MAHFYGTIQGNRGEASRCGVDSYYAVAAGWHGAIKVRLYRDENDIDWFSVYLIPWGASSGQDLLLASGRLDSGLMTEGKEVPKFSPTLVERFREQLAQEFMTND